ncbi:PTS transporter subunit EIIC [Enterococcus hulanensis]|uniref:PTS transporter subunit EIIC n=1 Tax=Enterococcus hulanensis TaxID=2559929 RepID=UPI001A8F7147|nr:PTS transporter subunit EIIC [Enterococcus hulanensis]MBO0458238.1 PTS transporter subunit EIIC [Enterococcus hulanensis]
MSKKEAVEKIISLVGSKNNINSVTHCFTRLRFKLNDRSKVNDKELSELPPVMGLYDRGGELQVILGNEVTEYYQEAEKLLEGKTQGVIDEKLDETVGQKSRMGVIDTISDIASAIFIPIIGVLGGCGTLQGILALLTFLNIIDATSGTYLVINAMGKGIFYFLPFFLAHTAAVKFGGKPFISMAIAAAMLYPDVLTAVTDGTAMTFAQLPLLLRDYTSTVFPIIVAAWLASVVEKQLRKVIPDILKMIFVPMFTIVIVVPIALMVFGPLLTYAMDGVTYGINALYKISPILTGTLVGGIWQLLVFVGISKAFISIFATEFATNGFSYFGAIVFFVAAMGQTGAVFAIAAKTKVKRIKAVTMGAGVSGLFGITEPALFGINVPAKRPFLIGSISAAIGGLITSVFGGKLYSLATGVLGIPSLINPKSGLDKGFFATVIASIITFIVAFVFTYKFGWNAENDKKYASKL